MFSSTSIDAKNSASASFSSGACGCRLSGAGIASRAEDEAPAGGPLLGAAELHALRARVLRGRPAAKEAVAKVLLLGETQRAVKAFLERLSEMPSYRLQRPPTPGFIGAWARLELPDGLRIELFSLPGAEEARPLWRPFASGALGGIVLERGAATLRLAEFLARQARVPLLLMTEGEIPVPLRGLSSVQQPAASPARAFARSSRPDPTFRMASTPARHSSFGQSVQTTCSTAEQPCSRRNQSRVRAARP